MKKQYLVFAFLIAVIAYLIYTQGCTLTFRCDRREGYDSSGICSTTASYGADSAFIASCSAYQKVCGEDSTSAVVHQINGAYGLNSVKANAKMDYLVKNVVADKCCDPAQQDHGNCTGNPETHNSPGTPYVPAPRVDITHRHPEMHNSVGRSARGGHSGHDHGAYSGGYGDIPIKGMPPGYG